MVNSRNFGKSQGILGKNSRNFEKNSRFCPIRVGYRCEKTSKKVPAFGVPFYKFWSFLFSKLKDLSSEADLKTHELMNGGPRNILWGET